MIPTLTDYSTGTPIRPATREEWQRSKHAAEHEPGGTGAFDLDGRTVFVDGDFPPAHTPEPWAMVEDGGGSAFSYELRATPGGKLRGIALVYADNPDDGTPGPEDTANAARIVACVNACEGIADPAAALKGMRDALARIARTPKHGEPEDAEPQYTQDWTDPNAPTLATMHTMIDMARAALALLDPSTAAR